MKPFYETTELKCFSKRKKHTDYILEERKEYCFKYYASDLNVSSESNKKQLEEAYIKKFVKKE
jgi:hypothetical protein